MVVTWDLALEFAACETSRERESKISARGARKGGKRQRTETQRATVSTRRVRGRLFSVLDDFVIGRAAAKRSLCSTRVVFLSLVLTRAFFLYAPLRARRHELGTAALDPSVRFIQVQPVGELDFSAGEARVDAVPSDNGEAFAQV